MSERNSFGFDIATHFETEYGFLAHNSQFEFCEPERIHFFYETPTIPTIDSRGTFVKLSVSKKQQRQGIASIITPIHQDAAGEPMFPPPDDTPVRLILSTN